jgi:hypothetical protein
MSKPKHPGSYNPMIPTILNHALANQTYTSGIMPKKSAENLRFDIYGYRTVFAKHAQGEAEINLAEDYKLCTIQVQVEPTPSDDDEPLARLVITPGGRWSECKDALLEGLITSEALPLELQVLNASLLEK